jgi:hypothetical protein
MKMLTSLATSAKYEDASFSHDRAVSMESVFENIYYRILSFCAM